MAPFSGLYMVISSYIELVHGDCKPKKERGAKLYPMSRASHVTMELWMVLSRRVSERKTISKCVYIYIWIGDIYKTIIDRKVVYVCLCLCKVWTIIICLPLFNIFSLYHSIKKDRNQTYHHFMKQEEIKRLHSNVYLYIYNLYTQYTYIHSSYIFCCAMGLLDEVPSCSLQFRGAGVGLCDGQPYFEPQPRGHHFLATEEW